MNFSKPINMIAAGSVMLMLILLTVVLIFNGVIGGDNQPIVYIIVIPVTAGLISFVVFWIMVERYINKKIKLIYRIISSKKITDEQAREFKMTDDVFSKLTKDTADWAVQQAKQIRELEEQAAFRKEFMGNLAHELKTPVFSIQGYILTLLEGGLEDEKVNRDFLERALNGVERISHLLEDLDEISKYEFNRHEIKLKKFDIVALARATFKELEQKAREKEISLTFNRNYDQVYVFADEVKIRQALTNLIHNSISYGSEKGTTTVRFHELDLVSDKTGKAKILVEVADNGLGIEEKHLPRLFERFYRVDKSRARHAGGSGLGLAIVKHIVEAHGESIKVRSTEGVGSTFSFTIPGA